MGASDSKPETLEELRRELNFNVEEINKWYKGHLQYCTDGVLSLEGFKKLYCDLFPFGDASKFAEHVFGFFDADGNGTIDLQEFAMVMTVAKEGSDEEKLTGAFHMYDLDNNGFITRKELILIIGSIYKMVEIVVRHPEEFNTAEKRADYFLQSMDKNEDDKLSLEEFLQGAIEDPTIVKLLRYDHW